MDALDAMRSERRREHWLLALVPSGALGRPLAALAILLLLGPVFFFSGAFSGSFAGGGTWSTAAFFCVILAYITPVFHLITERTEAAFDALAPRLALDPETLAATRCAIRCRTVAAQLRIVFLAVAIWLLQSWLLAGSVGAMGQIFTGSAIEIVMSVAPLLVWLFVTAATAALLDNARLFRLLAERVRVDLLDPDALTPFGYMTASSILVLTGAIASLSIMWLGGAVDPWTTIPGAVLLLGAVCYLVLTVLWPVHRVLRDARQAELRRLQMRIDAHGEAARAHDPEALAAIAPLLVYRGEIARVREWPLDLGVLTRFGLYLFIVPMTWVGAALIEYVVGFFIEG